MPATERDILQSTSIILAFVEKDWIKSRNIGLSLMLSGVPFGIQTHYYCEASPGSCKPTCRWAGQPRRQGWLPGRCKIIFSSSEGPDCLGGSPSLPSNGYRMLFPQGKSDRSVKLLNHHYLVPRLRIHGVIPTLSHASSCTDA